MNTISAINRIIAFFFQSGNGSNNIKKRGFQSILLFSSMFGAMGLNFWGIILTSKTLGPASFGDFKFIQTLWYLLTLLSTFGFLQSGSRVLLLETDPNCAKQIIGVNLLLALGMGIVVGLLTGLLARPLDIFFHTNVAGIVIALSPFVVGLTLQNALVLILQNTNRIALLSGLYIIPATFYLISILVFSKKIGLSTGLALLLQQGSLLLVVVLVIFILGPRLGSFRYFLQKIMRENKAFGFPIYTGSIANVATGYLNRLAISYWVNNTAIGYFSLASSFTEPLKLIPNATAISEYKAFSNQQKISKKMLWVTIAASIFSFAAAWIFFGKPLSWIYSNDFSVVGPMSRIIAFGAVAWGFGDFFNRFLGAHGQGEKLRNVAYAVGVVNVLGILVFTPIFGVNGAVITAVLAGFAYLILMLISYKGFISS